jgi:hypothetical protein
MLTRITLDQMRYILNADKWRGGGALASDDR